MHSRDIVTAVLDPLEALGGGLKLAQFIALLGLFDINPDAVRATLSRMRREGLLHTEKIGREVEYTLTDEMRRRLKAERDRSLTAPSAAWSGDWTTVLYQIPESDRSRREKLKRRLIDRGFGQLNPTTWISPRDERDTLRCDLCCDGDLSVVILTSRTGSLERDRDLVTRAWDLDEIAGHYRGFTTEWSPVLTGRLASPSEAFRLRTLLMSDWFHLPRHDPRLPLPLQPRGWAGQDAFALFQRLAGVLEKPALSYLAGLRAS
ncbi:MULTISPECIES: PaaX family transcriptional regulator [Brevundimonas]|uniref:PaaX family transcriptional regulator n=1 Tax=Brevundimonas TaxID=41275 RepID=UPI00035F5782|nr:PaaX family transcriptional regulator C-terminal domain-containing protein [Brevundimonas aurantiaca]MCC4293434.1 hypothetical protein [Brevundimonas aurantiaca]